MNQFFKPEDFNDCWNRLKAITYQEVAKRANDIIISNFEPMDYKPQEGTKTIELWILVDNSSRIWYTDSNRESLESKLDTLTDGNLKLIKLEGVLNV